MEGDEVELSEEEALLRAANLTMTGDFKVPFGHETEDRLKDEASGGFSGHNLENQQGNVTGTIKKRPICPIRSAFDLKIRAQMTKLNTLQNAAGQINEENIRNFSVEDIEAHQRVVDTFWESFSNYHEKVLQEVGEEDLGHPYFMQDVYDQGLNAYSQATKELGKLKSLLKAAKSPEVTSGGAGQSSNTLPRLPLPEFWGKYSEWKTFVDTFNSMVGPQHPDVERMIRLKACLKGDALKLINNIPITGDNFAIAWQKLVQRYENKRLIMAAHLNRILKLAPMQHKSAKGLSIIVSTTTTALEALEALGAPVQHWDIIIAHLIRKVIDESTREAWEVELGAQTEPPVLKNFLDFFRARTRALENVEGGEHNGEQQSTKTQPAKAKKVVRVHQGTSSERPTPSEVVEPTKAKVKVCSLCSGPHFVGPECSEFMTIPPAARKKHLAEKSLCYNCMGPHRVNKCLSEKRCRTCKGLHHTLIHLVSNSSGNQQAIQHESGESRPSGETTSSSGNNGSSKSTTHIIFGKSVSGESGPSSKINTASQLKSSFLKSSHQNTQRHSPQENPQSEPYHGDHIGGHRQSETYQLGSNGQINTRPIGDQRQSEKYHANHPGDHRQSDPYNVDRREYLSVNELQQSSSSSANKLIILATARVNVIKASGFMVEARVLIDQGSQASLVSERLIHQLKVQRQSSSVRIFGIGDVDTGSTRGIATFDIQSRYDSAAHVTITAHIMNKLTAKIPPFSCHSTVVNQLQDLQLADPQFNVPGYVDIIIGADSYGQVIGEKIIRFKDNQLIAQSTKLGWVVSGPMCCTDCGPKSSHLVAKQTVNQQLLELLKRFWVQEELPIQSSSSLSPDEQDCEKHFVETHQRDLTGRYIVRLPFKSSTEALGETKSTAIKMLQGTTKRLRTDASFGQLYRDFIKEYEALGHMQRVPSSSPEPSPVYYLPHHGVLKEDSTTTKLRVVFNGSSRSSTGISLNEILHPGPTLQINSTDVLIWLRRHRWVFGTDIVKMFRQIKVHPDDWDLQRILWVDENGETLTYQLITVTYGTTSAPWLSLRVLQQLVEDEGHRYPLAVPSITKGRYVDDIYGGAESEEELNAIVEELISLCMAGGLPLQKWSSNSPQLSNKLGISTERSSPVEFESSPVKVLGLCWQPQTDTFHYKSRHFNSSTITKRTVLSEIAQIYDPLGLIGPVIITGKIFIQELWLLKVNWDDPLPLEYRKRWQLFREQLTELNMLSIPRWINLSSEASTLQLHGFADASNLAMGAAVYLRTSSPGSECTVTLVCAKTRVAPLKKITVPRLELSAALILTELVAHAAQTLGNKNIETHLWSDSSVAITWIKGHASRWKDFVQNRVVKIQETSPTAQWRHINGVENPADCASRGISPKQLSEHHLWWTGPPWLVLPQEQWPLSSFDAAAEAALEERPSTIRMHPVRINEVDDVLNCASSLIRLLRSSATIRRAVNRFARRPTPNTPGITLEEIEEARIFWVKRTQHQHFEREINILTTGGTLPVNHRMATFTLFVDGDGILRLGGRLKNTTLDPDEIHPAILPRHSTLSSLIIVDAHKRSLHGGTQLTLAHIRQKYWIIGGRAPVTSHIRKCVICVRYRAERAQQLMGQLPARRVIPARPFLHSGVDFAGPFNLLRWRGSGANARMYKGYISVFVCMVTSAVHLEVVTDLTAEGFIAAFKRFTGRRGKCATMSSDRGLNFIGAQRELRELFDRASSESEKINALLTSDEVRWKLIPPHSPHMGGKWEAAVKSVKYHLHRAIGSSTLTYEELTTLLSQIEAVLNSRPLCPLTNDPEDTSALTPGHFLIGDSLTAVPEPSLLQLNLGRLDRWQLITRKFQYFWDRWSKECLHRYQAIYRWRQPGQNLEPGALVLITDEVLPPSKWPLARVIAIHPGRDELTRVVDLRVANPEGSRAAHRITSRAVHRLVPLPIDADWLEGQPEIQPPGGQPPGNASSSGDDEGGRNVRNLTQN